MTALQQWANPGGLFSSQPILSLRSARAQARIEMVLGMALGYDVAEATTPDVKTRIGLMESSGERPPSDSARELGLVSETTGRFKRQKSS